MPRVMNVGQSDESQADTSARGAAGADIKTPEEYYWRRRLDQHDRRMLDVLPKHDAAAPSFLERLAMPALLCFAWLLFELTANATLSVMVACLRFGWDDFRSAWWLKQVDPHRRRALTCFWFYVASGVWKAALTPILAVMIIGVAWGMFSPRAMPPNHAVALQVWSAIVVGLGASSLLVLLVVVAVAHALTSSTRVWVHYDLHQSRRERQWPPRWTRRVWQHENRGRAILATALFFATVGLPPLLFRTIILMGKRMEIAAMLLVVFGVPIAATTIYASIRGRVFARRPWECWPESVVDISAPCADGDDWEETADPTPSVAPAASG